MKRFLFVLILVAISFMPDTGDALMTTPGVVGSAVLASIAESPSVRVVVLFDGDDLSLTDLGARSQAIAERRDAVLDQITPAEFRVTDTFANISVVGGYVTYEGLKKLVRDYRVQKIDLDVPGHMALAESTVLIRARDVQAQGVTGAGVVVAVLDTGIDTHHPDLSDDLVGQQCFCTNADGVTGCCPGGKTEASGVGAAEDEQGHGTHVSGIITSGGRVAPRGVAPGRADRGRSRARQERRCGLVHSAHEGIRLDHQHPTLGEDREHVAGLRELPGSVRYHQLLHRGPRPGREHAARARHFDRFVRGQRREQVGARRPRVPHRQRSRSALSTTPTSGRSVSDAPMAPRMPIRSPVSRTAVPPWTCSPRAPPSLPQASAAELPASRGRRRRPPMWPGRSPSCFRPSPTPP